MSVTLTNEMIQGAVKAQNKYGVPASVTLGQIMLESGGNYSGGLSGLAYNYNNLFGIKSGSSWQGETVTLPTTEYQNGTPYKTNAKFRVYSSVSDSIEDHAILLNKPIYTNKTSQAKSLEDYVSAMGSVYATDPQYSTKLLSVINSNNLTQYDNGNYSVDGSKLPSNVNNSTSGGVSEVGYFKEKANGILTTIVKILAIGFLLIMAVVFFMGAFNIKIPTKKNIKNTVKKKATGEQTKKIGGNTENIKIKVTQ